MTNDIRPSLAFCLKELAYTVESLENVNTITLDDKESVAVYVSVVLDSFEWCNGLPSTVRMELRSLVVQHKITFADLMAVQGNDTPAAVKFKREFIEDFCKGTTEDK